ncbi:MAG: LpxI family protein [Acidobacteriota bacterium]
MQIQRLGLIAGNGRFPFLVLEEALKKGIPVTVAAIREETSPEIESYASETGAGGGPTVSVNWLGVGQLGKLIRVFKEDGVSQAVMAGQVKHVRIFSPKGSTAASMLRSFPDLRMVRLLISLPQKNTQSLIGGIAGVLKQEGIELLDSSLLISDLLAQNGVLTRRPPDREEEKDIQYGRELAREIARLDLGQTIVIKDQAVVAIEAMEGTDATIRRASELVAGQKLTVVKVSSLNLDMRFDVPVIGLETLGVLEECNVSAIAIDAKKTLILDRNEVIREADRLGISIVSG